MPELKAVFVTRSRLLADLLARAIAIRLAETGVEFRAEIVGDDVAATNALASPPDAIVLFEDGPRLSALDGLATPILTVSADLSRVWGVERDEASELTSDALARWLLDCAR